MVDQKKYQVPVLVKVVQKITYLALLQHHLEKAGTPTSLQPSALNPGFIDASGDISIHAGLQTYLSNVASDRRFSDLGIALVDLTKDVNKPEFAGHNHTRQLYIASMAKIAAMYAAHQLQYDLSILGKNSGAKSQRDLYDSAWKGWVATQTPAKGAVASSIKQKSPKIEKLGDLLLLNGKRVLLSRQGPPSLGKIFGAQGAGGPATGFNKTNQKLDELNEKWTKKSLKELGKLGFTERMKLMVGWSDNMAAGSCIHDVGYLYCASALFQSGLYEPNRGGGLWLGGDYIRGAEYDWIGDPVGGFRQGGTALSLAVFLTLLAQDRLVSPAASASMKMLLDKGGDGAYSNSWFGIGLKHQAAKINNIYSKIGIGDKGQYSDCALIERDAEGKMLRYVAVGIEPRAGSYVMEELIAELDKCIQQNNGISP